jgi:hypothetical protein
MRCWSRLAGVVLTLLLLTGAGAWLAPLSASPSAEADFLDRVNGARAQRGLGPLASHADVADVARRWSGRMRSENRLSHNPNLANEVKVDWEKLAENVGVGPDVNTIHQAFMNSTAHRTNILDPAFTHIGIGVVTGDDGKLWVTEVFVRIKGATTSKPPPVPTTTAAPRPAPAPRPTTTAAPRPALAPPTTARPAPAPVPPPAPPSAPAAAAVRREPHPRLVLVLEGLRQLDGR